MPKRAKTESGQALVETAIAFPILILLIATIIDGSLYLFAGQNAIAAANAVARQVEAQPDMTQLEAQAYLDNAYPGLAGATVGLTAPSRTTEALSDGYKVWDPAAGVFRNRPSNVSWDKRTVTVTYEGKWLTPVTMSASAVAVGAPEYTLTGRSTAVIDTTFETW